MRQARRAGVLLDEVRIAKERGAPLLVIEHLVTRAQECLDPSGPVAKRVVPVRAS